MEKRKESIAYEAAPKVPLGNIAFTRNAILRLEASDAFQALARHQRGDWGLVDEEDWQENDRALTNDGRLLSAYQSSAGDKFWIITEWDRSVTTILMPEDY